MNKKLFVISVLVLACSACGTVPVDFIDQNSAVDGSAAADGASAADAGSPADAGKAAEGSSAADAGSPADATKVVTLDDKDEDGFLPKVDCNDNDPAVHPGATELCNGKDDNCDNVVDEGCPAPQQPVDKDGDGHYTAPDCNDNDPSVFPGATELCNGVDDDCDGVVDEGCPANQPASGEVVVSVKYTSSKTRVLNVQLFDDTTQIGKWWGKSTSSDGTTVSASLTGVNLNKACGIRLNVSVGNPAYAWLCEGNGSTANLDPGAEIDIKWGTTTLHKSNLVTWSAPGGTNQGCSAVLLRNGCSL